MRARLAQGHKLKKLAAGGKGRGRRAAMHDMPLAWRLQAWYRGLAVPEGSLQTRGGEPRGVPHMRCQYLHARVRWQPQAERDAASPLRTTACITRAPGSHEPHSGLATPGLQFCETLKRGAESSSGQASHTAEREKGRAGAAPCQATTVSLPATAARSRA